MKSSELAVVMMEMTEEVDAAIERARDDLFERFTTTSKDNEQVTDEAAMHQAMVDFLTSSAIRSKWNKEYEKNKKDLDKHAKGLGLEPSSCPGETLTIAKSNIFKFTKKQNKDGESTLVVDLISAFARMGVDKATIDKAVAMATKPKRGNIYYDVSLTED